MSRMKSHLKRPGSIGLTILSCALVLLAGFVGAATVHADVPPKAREGATLYEDSAYSEAADAFRSATIAAPEDARWRYDLGLSEAQDEDYESALNNLQTTVGLASPELANHARFNVGNIHYAMENYGEAAKSYRNTLLRDPTDADAKRNLELAMRRLAEQDPSEEKSDEESEEGDDNEDQEKKDNEQKSDEENKDESEENKDESEGDQDPQEQDPQDEEQPQPDPQSDSTLTREQAERILRALAEEEAKLRDKARNLQMLPAPAGKDW